MGRYQQRINILKAIRNEVIAAGNEADAERLSAAIERLLDHLISEALGE